mgnify:FL=1
MQARALGRRITDINGGGVDARFSDVLEHRPDDAGVHRQWGDEAYQTRFRRQVVDALDVWRPYKRRFASATDPMRRAWRKRTRR